MSVDILLNLLIALLSKSGEISLLIQKMQGEGRTKLTPEEWAALTTSDDVALQGLVDAIAKAKGTPPV